MNRRDEAPRRIDRPEPALFRMRLVRGGPWVAAEIRVDDAGEFSAVIDGEPAGPAHRDPAMAARVMDVWISGVRIDAGEHAYLLAMSRWARQSAPDRPEANPDQPINLMRMPPLW